MTSEQEQAVSKYRKQYDDIGWRVYLDENPAVVTLTALGPPYAVRSWFIAPDGTVTAGPMS